MKKSILKCTLAAFGFAFGVLPSFTASAANMYWNGAAGTWDATTANWGTAAAGPYTSVWPNTTADSGTFGAAGYTVTLGANITMNKLTNNAASGTLTIAPGAGTQITFGGTSPTIHTAAKLTITPPLKGAVTLTKAGAGQLQLNNNGQTISKFVVTGGIISTANTNKFGTANGADALTLNGGGWGTDSTSQTIDSRLGITLGSSGGSIGSSSAALTMTLGNKITGAGGINFGGGAVVGPGYNAAAAYVLNNPANDYAGTTTLTVGTLTLGAAGVIPDSSALTINGGTLALNGMTETVNALTMTAGTISGTGTLIPSAVTVSASGSATISGVISGSTGLRKLGSGTLTLGAVHTYTGDTTNSAGAISINGTAMMGNGVLKLAGGTLIATANRSTANILNNTAIEVSANSTIQGDTASGSRFLRFDVPMTGTAGTLTLKNATAGGTFDVVMYGGSYDFTRPVVIGASGDPGNVQLSIFNTNGAPVTYSGVISGYGSLRRSASSGGTGGELVLSGDNTYTGGTTINDGALLFGINSTGLPVTSGPIGTGALATGSGNGSLVAFGGARELGNDINLNHNISVGGANDLTLSGSLALGTGARTLLVTNTGITTIAGVISGSAVAPANNLIKSGGGVLVVTNDNTYTGNTVINDGKFVVNNTAGSATGSGDVTVAAAGTLAGSGSISGAVTLAGTIAPGASPGTLTTGSQTWTNGGKYKWEINDAVSSAGTDPGWDLLNINGTLTIGSSDVAPFIIDVTSLTTGNVAGPVANFDDTQTYSWTIAQASGGIVGFSPEKFQVLTDNFANALVDGQFTVTQVGNAIVLNFVLGDPPAIATAPASQTVAAGSSVTFSVEVTGTAPFTYQWRKDGVSISGATDSAFTINPVSGTDVADYSVRVFNSFGFATSSAATLSVAPGISVQPVGATAAVNSSYTFTVVADGQPTLTYQWKKDGVDISGATQASYTIDPVRGVNAGGYTVAVSNSVGFATSSSAVLDVPPDIVSQPADVLSTGGTITLSVSVTGTTPFSYSWRKGGEALVNGGRISGADSATLQITSSVEADSGSYDVVISNSAGSTNSNPATVTVETAPVITSEPSNLTVNAGDTAQFSITVSGAEPITYEWKKDGNTVSDGGRVSGATTTTLTISNVEQADAGSYTVTATNFDGSDTSVSAILMVIDPPVITTQPLSQDVGAGSNAVFTVAFTGTAPAIQWKKNGADISGATSATLTLTGLTLADSGNYTVVLSNAAAVVTSDAATLTVYDAPVVTTHPSTQTRPTAGSVTFTVVATGTTPAYQWKKDGINLSNDERISGATSASLTIANLTAADDGSYTVVISNIAGEVTGGPATLTVIDGVAITAEPQSATVNAGQDATFTVTATGGGTLTYQWKKNGSDISGATLTALTLSNVGLGDAGDYTVLVSNEAGSLLSATATLTVHQAPNITGQPQSLTVAGGQSATFSVTATGNPLGYQWYKNNTLIADATASSYTIASAQTADIGIYYVVVSNLLGVATSAEATLSISGVLFSEDFDTNSSAEWTVNVANTGNHAANVYFDYSTIGIPPAPNSGGTTRGAKLEANFGPSVPTNGAGVSISPIGHSFDGDYTLKFDAWLNFNGPLNVGGSGSTHLTGGGILTSGTINQGIDNIQSVLFSASGDGGSTSDYRAYTSQGLSGAQTVYHAPNNIRTDDTNAYYNVFGSKTAPAAQIALYSQQSSTTRPGALGFAWREVEISKVGSNVTWKIDGLLIATVTTNTLSFNGKNILLNQCDINTTISTDPNRRALTFGLFDNVRVETNGAGIGPAIVGQPQNTTNNAGTIATLSVTANSPSPLRYQWQKSGVNIAGATDSSLNITNVLAADAGSYRVLVFNDSGVVTSTAATLTIVDPAINTQPQSQTVTAFQSVTFTVEAGGTGSLLYQWKKDGTDISGATSSSLTIDPVHVSDAGLYTVAVTGDLGTVVSDAATLTVNKAAQTITFGALDNKTYGDATFPVSASASSGLPVSYSVSGPATVSGSDITITGAGVVTVTALQAGDDDYEAAANVEQSFTVAKALLTVSADNKSRSYGSANPTLTASYSGFVNGEDLLSSGVTGAPDLATAATETSSVGAYAITTAEGTLAAANYSFGTAAGTLTITKAALAVTAEDKSRVYGDANPVFTVAYTGFVNGEDQSVLSGSPEVTSAASVTSNVGTYPITVAIGTLSAANYDVTTFNNGTLTVTAAPLSLVVDNKVKLQGTANPEFTGTITGIRNGDPITASYSTTATESSPVGNYAITGSFNGDVGNYSTTITHGVLSVFEAVAINSQPTGQLVDQGATATFSVTAAGGDLNYQWRLNGVDIAGATGSVYEVTSAQPADAGAYTVLVSNPAGSLLSDPATLTITLDPNAPKLVVLAPKANFIYTNSSSLMLTGTVSDTVYVSSVEYDLNGAGFVAATVDYVAPGKPSNWVATATMAAGTNTVIVKAADRAGNVTIVPKITFFYHVPSTFTYAVTTEGNSGATITPSPSAWGYPTNGATLNVGRTYKMKAQVLPGTNSIITNITYTAAGGETGVLFTNTAVLPTITLNFTMKTNMHIDFNTRENPLNVFGGTYYGLFSDTNNGVSHHSAGYAQIKITSKYTYSAKLIVDGNTIGFGGKLPIDGKLINAVVSRTKQAEKGPLSVSFDVDMTGQDKITGTIAGLTNGWSSTLLADRMTWTTNAGETPVAWTNAYTAIVPGFTNKADGPVGSSYGVLSVDLKGKAKWIGGAGDYEVKGSPVVSVTYLSKDGYWPFYAPMYKAKRALARLNALGAPVVISEYNGSMMGWLQLTTNGLGNLRPEGEVSWIKTGLTNILYSGGFTNLNVPVTASRWLAPISAGQYPLDSTTTNWNLTFTEGNLATPYVAAAQLYTNKLVAVKDLVNKPAAALAVKTGLMKGTFVHPSDSTTVSKWFGVALQDLNIGEGWFMGPSEGGKMEFAPAP